MKVSSFALRLYFKSLTIRERLGSAPNIKSTDVDKSFSSKVDYWGIQVGETSDRFLKTRLYWSDIKERDLPKLLSPIKTCDFACKDIPRWVNLLDEFLNSIKDVDLEKKDKKIPFFHILLPIVNFFESKITYNRKLLGENIHKDLKDYLVTLFSKLSSQCLLEYMHKSDLSYRAFVNHILNNNYKEFFSHYAYLTRLLFTKGYYWVANTNFLLSALENDLVEISRKLKVEVGDIKILQIYTDLSESHNGGKNVVFIKTNKGSFVFKSRDVGLDKTFFDFIQYINKSFSIKQYSPWIIDKKNYGWMEYVGKDCCISKEQVEKYYTRVGSLLCFFHIFGATDLHSENLISKGEYPVFIDLETLLNPITKLNNKHLSNLNSYIDIKYGLSVSRAGILPQWLLGPDNNIYNNSALGGSKHGIKYPLLVWQNINSEKISFRYIDTEPPKDKNLVYLHKNIQKPSKYTEFIQAGYTQTYNFLLLRRKRKDFIRVLSKFSNKRNRFIFRATKVYTLLLDYLNHPDYMKDGVSRSLEFEILAKGLIFDLEKKYIFWDVFEDELRQLEDDDVPYFVGNTSSTSFGSIHSVLYKRAMQYRGYNKMLSLLNKLNESDLQFQLGIIRNSLETEKVGGVKERHYNFNHQLSIQGPKKKDIEDVLNDIKSKIVKSRIEVGNRVTWVSFVSNIVSHTFGYKPIGVDTANGNMGVAIFLAALYSRVEDKDSLKLVDEAVLPIVDVLKEGWSRKEFIMRFGVGGTTGIGSTIYGFTKLFEFTHKNAYLEYALEFANLVSDDDINNSLRQDVVSGNAGLLLALVKLYEITKTEELRNIMHKCFYRIIESGYQGNTFVNWNYQQNKKLIGFSHGSSGVLYSLSRYLNHCKDLEKLLQFIGDILTYEGKLFDDTQGNWPDFRYSNTEFGVVSWCHGALGVGMSRLGLLDNSPYTKIIEKDIKRSIEKMISTGQHLLDTACCGNSGRIDFTLELRDSKFYSERLKEYSCSLVSAMISRYQKDKDFNYFSHFKTKDVNVGFYQGLSGIGYELIRFLDPDNFQSVLLFR